MTALFFSLLLDLVRVIPSFWQLCGIVGGVISCTRWNWLDWYVWGRIAIVGLLAQAPEVWG